MKVSLSLVALGLALAPVFAFSQSFGLRAGAGATMNGNVIFVNPGASFQLEVWADMPSSHNTAVLNLALAFDRTNGVRHSATPLDGKLGVSAVTPGMGTGFPSILANNNKRGAADNVHSGNNFGFAGGAARPFVSFSSFGINPASPDVPLVGQFLVATITLTNTLIGNEIYGDQSNEAGLFIAHQGGTNIPDNGASGVGSSTPVSGMRFGSAKYHVQAVPEPGTMLALGAGIAAFVARRRKKA